MIKQTGIMTVNLSTTETPDRLLEAVSDLLSSRDSIDISLAEISAHAKLNHGLIRYYFRNKDGMLLALLKRDAEIALHDLKRLIETNIPPLKKLELHIRGVVLNYYRYPYINALINYLQNSSDESAAALTEIFILPLHNYQSQLLSEAEQSGMIRKVDPVMFYFMTIGACDFFFRNRRTLRSAFKIDTIDHDLAVSYANHVVDFVVSSLSQAPAPKEALVPLT
ncbi:MAG: TetR family transcriptional regulator [Hyphomonadaceae bacterium]|nr:TetR family transcriptional regulator [Hyphomonadaceae bacterium]